jgi:hypothetical protein
MVTPNRFSKSDIGECRLWITGWHFDASGVILKSQVSKNRSLFILLQSAFPFRI